MGNIKNQAILSRMSVAEKINLSCGADSWRSFAYAEHGLPAMMVADGPHGVRYQAEGGDMLGINKSADATCFPTAALSSCSWNRELLDEIGAAIADEALSFGVGTILGPGINIKRSPLCGRNFEYISEDPYLSGSLAAAYVKGMQAKGVGACIKHFAANSQEYKRFSSTSYVDERTLREIYLAAFEQVVREAKPAMVMSAYNRVNGAYCSDNHYLLTKVLREEWGFDGMVVTDWGGMHNRVAAYSSGCDWSMPGGPEPFLQRRALEAFNNGTLSENEIDASVDRIITRALEAKQNEKIGHVFDAEKHHQLARRAAAQSMVLLQNQSNILPLATENVVLIGHMAKEPRYQGAGSSHINPTKLTSLCDAAPTWKYVQGCDKLGASNALLLEEISEAAITGEVCVVLAGLPDNYEAEGFDRKDMRMPEGHVQMIEAAAEANPNTVVVLLCGSPVEMPWANKVKAIVYAGLPGQAGGEAIHDVLTGKVNPCGRLTESWPLSYDDVPCSAYYGAPHKDAQYREGVYVGYRYYETANVPVRYPFGFGLSYTDFEYSNLAVSGNDISLTVRNTGKAYGAEVVQLYVAAPQNSALHRPKKELKGFERVCLDSGEAAQVLFTLDERSFALWDGEWKAPTGTYEIQLASSVQNVHLRAQITAGNADVAAPEWQKGSWYASPKGLPPKADFEKQLGRHIAESKPPKKGEFTMESTILEMAGHSFILKMVLRVMERFLAKQNGGKVDYDDPTFRMAMTTAADCALFAVLINGNGVLSEKLAFALLDIANGHFWRGVKRLLSKKKPAFVG